MHAVNLFFIIDMQQLNIYSWKYNNCYMEFISAHNCYCGVFNREIGINVKHGIFTTSTGLTMWKDELSITTDQEWADSFFEIARILQGVALSTSETIMLIALLMFSPGKNNFC